MRGNVLAEGNSLSADDVKGRTGIVERVSTGQSGGGRVKSEPKTTGPGYLAKPIIAVPGNRGIHRGRLCPITGAPTSGYLAVAWQLQARRPKENPPVCPRGQAGGQEFDRVPVGSQTSTMRT